MSSSIFVWHTATGVYGWLVGFMLQYGKLSKPATVSRRWVGEPRAMWS